MTADYEWKEEYSVGVSLLDDQHKYMFDQGKKITHLQPEETKKLVVDLYRYIMQHFKVEEQHMQEIGFPEVEGHRQLHKNIMKQLNEMTLNFVANERNTLNLKLFFLKWLRNHILQQDKKYFEFVNK